MDAALSLLSSHISNNPDNVMVLDENAINCDLSVDAKIITHRYDVFLSLKRRGLNAEFSDLILPDIQKDTQMAFRVAKEKSINHHLIQHYLNTNHKDASLYISGRKNEGIKGYYDALRKLSGVMVKQTKHKDTYLLSINKQYSDPIVFQKLNYHDIAELADVSVFNKGYQLLTKEGVFSRKRLDPGSEYLLETLKDSQQELQLIAQHGAALDLGCGSGHLTLALHALGFRHLIATDNNAAALATCTSTCKRNEIECEVIASDAGADLSQRFELIFCNPPFHQGFKPSDGLSQKFAQNTYKLLSQNGRAYFVCNSFVGMEKLAMDNHLAVEALSNNGQFKVLKLWRR
jgi:16S rRNA (guanine1207-N2)-methyltransferase